MALCTSSTFSKSLRENLCSTLSENVTAAILVWSGRMSNLLARLCKKCCVMFLKWTGQILDDSSMTSTMSASLPAHSTKWEMFFFAILIHSESRKAWSCRKHSNKSINLQLCRHAKLEVEYRLRNWSSLCFSNCWNATCTYTQRSCCLFLIDAHFTLHCFCMDRSSMKDNQHLKNYRSYFKVKGGDGWIKKLCWRVNFGQQGQKKWDNTASLSMLS